jgi:hypothetical protein
MISPRTLAAAVVVAAVAVPAASAAPQTLRLTSVETSFTTSRPITKAAPPRVGDQLIFSDVLYDSGRRVGKAENLCTIVSAARIQCLLTAHLPKGDVVLSGSVPKNAKVSHFAVIGGVGAYAAARGEATGREVSATRSLIELQLS